MAEFRSNRWTRSRKIFSFSPVRGMHAVAKRWRFVLNNGQLHASHPVSGLQVCQRDIDFRNARVPRVKCHLTIRHRQNDHVRTIANRHSGEWPPRKRNSVSLCSVFCIIYHPSLLPDLTLIEIRSNECTKRSRCVILFSAFHTVSNGQFIRLIISNHIEYRIEYLCGGYRLIFSGGNLKREKRNAIRGQVDRKRIPRASST